MWLVATARVKVLDDREHEALLVWIALELVEDKLDAEWKVVCSRKQAANSSRAQRFRLPEAVYTSRAT